MWCFIFLFCLASALFKKSSGRSPVYNSNKMFCGMHPLLERSGVPNWRHVYLFVSRLLSLLLYFLFSSTCPQGPHLLFYSSLSPPHFSKRGVDSLISPTLLLFPPTRVAGFIPGFWFFWASGSPFFPPKKCIPFFTSARLLCPSADRSLCYP